MVASYAVKYRVKYSRITRSDQDIQQTLVTVIIGQVHQNRTFPITFSNFCNYFFII